MSKGSELQRMGFYEAFFWTGKKGECAFCEHKLSQATDIVFHCEDCGAAFSKLENGNLDYIGRFRRTNGG
jgi:predicted amidophosphoribosyltransferase